MIPSIDPDKHMVAVGGEDGRVIMWNLTSLRCNKILMHESQETHKEESILMQSYNKDKERSFSSFLPFHEIRSRKIFCTAIANVVTFAPKSAVEKARHIFRSQLGISDDLG